MFGCLELGAWGGWLAEVWMFGCLEKFGCWDVGMFGDLEVLEVLDVWMFGEVWMFGCLDVGMFGCLEVRKGQP